VVVLVGWLECRTRRETSGSALFFGSRTVKESSKGPSQVLLTHRPTYRSPSLTGPPGRVGTTTLEARPRWLNRRLGGGLSMILSGGWGAGVNLALASPVQGRKYSLREGTLVSSTLPTFDEVESCGRLGHHLLQLPFGAGGRWRQGCQRRRCTLTARRIMPRGRSLLHSSLWSRLLLRCIGSAQNSVPGFVLEPDLAGCNIAEAGVSPSSEPPPVAVRHLEAKARRCLRPAPVQRTYPSGRKVVGQRHHQRDSNGTTGARVERRLQKSVRRIFLHRHNLPQGHLRSVGSTDSFNHPLPVWRRRWWVAGVKGCEGELRT